MKKQKEPRPAQTSGAQKKSHQPAEPGSSHWLAHPALHLALIVLIGILAYANSFSVSFNFDDAPSITDNPVIKNLSSFLSGAGYSYNPRRFMGYLSIALNYHFGGLDVTGYHVVNLTIHLITACLVYVFVRITLKTPFSVSGDRLTVIGKSLTAHGSPLTVHRSPFTVFIPLFTALLFVTHPIQTQAVTYIIQRLAALVTLFYLAALICYVKARLAMVATGDRLTVIDERENPSSELSIVNGKNPLFSGRVMGWFVLSLLFTVLAMRTKEVAATLPLAIVLYEFSFFGAQRRKRLFLLVPALLTMLIIPIGIMLSGKPAGQLLSDVSAMTRETVAISRGDYLLTQFSVIATYIRLLFLPINQNLDYDYPVFHSLFVPRVFLSFLLIVALIGLAVWLYRKSANSGKAVSGVNGDSKSLTDHGSPLSDSPFTVLYRLIAFGILWFFITLLVESSVIPIRDVIFEHRIYLPAVGACIATAAALLLLERVISHRGIVAAGMIITLLLTITTWNRNRVWQNPVALWTDVVAKSPEKNRPHYNLGLAYKNENRLGEAEQEYRRALAIEPKDLESLNNLGILCAMTGRFDEALSLYSEAIAINKDNFLAWFNIGSVFAMQGRFAEAETHFLQSIKLKADHANSHYNLGLLYQKLDRLGEAENEAKAALNLDPRNPQILNNLGVIYLKGNRPADAVPLLEQAVKLQPGNYGYQTNLGRAKLLVR